MDISRIVNSYKKMALPAKASLWFMVMSIIQKGIQFLVTPIYTNLLTTEEYGYYSIYVTWQSVFMILATLNLSAGVFYNGMLKYENDRNTFISSMQGLSNACTIIVFILILIFYRPLSIIMGLDKIVVGGMFVSFLFFPSFDFWSQHNRYTFNYRPMIVWTILFAIVSSGLGIALISIIPEKKYSIVFGMIITQILWGIIFYVSNLVKGKTLYKAEYWKYAFKFNFPLIPHYLSFVLLGQADRIMIEHYYGKGEVAIYSVSYSVSLMLTIIINAISATLAPWTYQKIQKRELKSLKTTVNVILILLSGIVIICVLIAPELVNFLGTDEYIQAIWIIPPVMLSCFFSLLYSLFANIEFYYEKSVFAMIASVIGAATNIVLNAIFIPRYSFLAAGYTTYLSYVFLAILHYIFMRRCLRRHNEAVVYDSKFIMITTVILSIISFSIMSVYNHILIRYSIVGVLIVILCIYRRSIIELLKNIRTKE